MFHLEYVTGENGNVGLVCDRTVKYVKALSKKLWIVSIGWIDESLKQGRLVDPV